ncbi:MAG: hypothetical protein JXB49_18150 [Bacteroidales bacterium]|nr:hypothetical protein [Bacteroidales bacterium]
MKEVKVKSYRDNAAIPKISEDRIGLQQLILQLTEQKTENRFSDVNLDRENEKIKLISGKEITIAEVKKTIAEAAGPYFPIFKNETEYYSEIFRLNNWKEEDPKQYYKPPIVGKYTNEIIYQRFSNGILPMLQHLNPYIGNRWNREYRHFQWLTEEGKEKVEIFISEAVKIMKTCDNWYEFRVKYYKEYGIPFQMDAFKDTNQMIEKIVSHPSDY